MNFIQPNCSDVSDDRQQRRRAKMKRFRSRSDSPCTTSDCVKIRGYLSNLSNTFVSKLFEKSAVSRALSRLKARKKLWYVFDEETCQLLYYKSESEASEERNHLGSINIRGAAISLDLDENNQFVIHSEGKEHVLIADSHESMMLWVLALQARQDSMEKKTENADLIHRASKTESPSLLHTENGRTNKNQSKIMRTHSLQLHDKTRTSTANRNQHNPLTRMRSLLSAGHIMENDANNTEKDKPFVKSQLSTVTQGNDKEEENSDENAEDNVQSKIRFSSSSSSASTTSPITPANSPIRSDGHDTIEELQSPMSNNGDLTSQSAAKDSSDSDSDEENFTTAQTTSPSVSNVPTNLATLTSISSSKINFLRKMNSDGIRTDELAILKERASSLSATSVSSDSAVGTSECAHSLRIHELESELMSAKCDLAKALNRESSYKCVIDEKIHIVTELESRLKLADDVNEDISKSSPSKTISASSVKRLQEKCRILQNHNRFLNEEVLKLSKMLQLEQDKGHQKQLQILRMERENDQMKRDYVFLLQSSLRITNSDGPEILEVFMYGETRHKERVLCLLDEARKINPTLPAYENLTRSLCHVDPLGFRRQCTDEGLVLHYICRQLHQHYNNLSAGYEIHQQQWKRYLRQHSTLHRTKELKALVRGGIPAHLRSRVWALLYRAHVSDIMEDKGPHYYSYLCSLAPDDERVSQHKRQIALDLLRTMPDNIRFSDLNADGVRKMQEVLQAFCLHNPSLGYCQGMNFLVGMCLLFLEPEDTFWCLVAITERYFTPHYFDENLIGAQADQEVLKDLLRERMPALWRHLAKLDIELCTITLNWFLAVFFDCVPFETLLRIWDCFLLEGPKVLFRFALAILTLNEKAILARHETVSIMRQLKATAKLCFDVDTLFKTAFECLRPFTRRQDIAAKQACYYKTLKEHAKKMEMEKVALRGKEKMLSEMEILNANQLVIECAAVYDKDKLWLCHGHQNGAQISKVNCEESIMYRLNIEFESRVMCMHSLDDETILLGTLSHFVQAYSTRARRLLWETRLNDSVLALGAYEEDGVKQVFAGLADGTIAVIDNVGSQTPKPDTFYIPIGSSPVTCIILVDRRLWCGSANRVLILSARTLDTVDQFQTSSSILDYISMLVPEENGVWVTIRGSSVLQLWDSQNLTCKLLYDVKDNRYPKPLKQEDETSVNQARITAVLPFGGSVLVGTAEGILIIYDIVTRISRSASSSDFTPRRQLEASSVGHIQERIQELLLEQKRRDEDETNFSREKNRTDSGCYTTPNRTPLHGSSRRESQHVVSDSVLATQLEDEEDDDQEVCNSPEDRSEATSASTVRATGAVESFAVTPESQILEDSEAKSNVITEVMSGAFGINVKPTDTDRDSGRSSTSTQGKLCEDADDVTNNGMKRLCTCNQLGNKSLKCRHCLLETSEALRQLFSKYSLGTTQTNHIDSSLKCQNLLNSSKLLRSEITSKICNGKAKGDSPKESLKDEDDEDSDSSSEPSVNNTIPLTKESLERTSWLNEDDKSPTKSSCLNKSENSPSRPRVHRKRLENDSLRRRSSRNSLFRAISADDVTRWVKSQETLSSSFGSDSYDFDDVFVTYTEDENERISNWMHHPIQTGIYHSKETEVLLESIRARSLTRRRSSNICEYTIGTLTYGNDQWPSSSRSSRSRSSSPWIHTSATSVSSFGQGRNPPLIIPSSSPSARPKLLDIRSQLPAWSVVSDSEGPTTTTLKPTAPADKSEDTSPNEWLSYEDSITENETSTSKTGVINKDLLHLDCSSSTQKGSETASNVSFCSTDVPYTFELNLQEKIKISDKPIKCLLEARCGGEPIIISCAGCYGDDEAVLKWTRLGDEKLWTNDPIIEVCPYTNAIKPSPYARSRLPCRSTPLTSNTSETDCTSRNALMSAVSTPTSVVGSGLAKVQNMFLRVHDKV